MRLTITGFNYEGLMFRGIYSETDEVNLKITLEGNEDDICSFVLEEFSYGQYNENPIVTVEDLVNGYKNQDIPNADGCGGVTSITDENGNRLFTDEWMEVEENCLDLGVVKVPTDVSLNQIVADKIEE